MQEIDRLDLIITQINNFAHPPELNFKPLDLRAPMKKAIELVRAALGSERTFPWRRPCPMTCRGCVGDETALAEAFAHLVANAAEATHGQPTGRITLSAKPIHDGDQTSGVVVTVHDNGTGHFCGNEATRFFLHFAQPKPAGWAWGSRS